MVERACNHTKRPNDLPFQEQAPVPSLNIRLTAKGPRLQKGHFQTTAYAQLLPNHYSIFYILWHNHRLGLKYQHPG